MCVTHTVCSPNHYYTVQYLPRHWGEDPQAFHHNPIQILNIKALLIHTHVLHGYMYMYCSQNIYMYMYLLDES